MVESSVEKRALNELLVRDLRAELNKRSLDTKGVKRDLIDRLTQALKDEGVEDPTYILIAPSTVDSPAPKKPRISGLDSSRDEDEPEVEIEEVAQEVEQVNNATTDKSLPPIDNEQPVKTEAPIQQIKPVETIEPVEIVEPVETVQPVEIVQTTVTEEPVDEGFQVEDELDPEAYEQLTSQKDDTIDAIDHANVTAEEEKHNDDESEQVTNEANDKQGSVTKPHDSNNVNIIEHKDRIEVTTPLLDEKKRISDSGDGEHKGVNGDEQADKIAREKEEENDLASLWISNVAPNSKAADIKKLFEEHGKVLTTKVISSKGKSGDSAPKTFAALQMGSKIDAANAIEALNDYEFNGAKIAVEQKTFAPNIKKLLKDGGSKSASASSKVVSPSSKRSSDKRRDESRSLIKEDKSRHTSRSYTKSKHSSSRLVRETGPRARGPVYGRPITSRGRGGGYRGSSRAGVRPLMSIRSPPASSSRGGLRGQLLAVRRGRQMDRRPTYDDRRSDIAARELEYERRRESESRMRDELRQRDLEYKAREQQLKLQREEERLRFERERLEREKLEFQQLKLSAEQNSYVNSRPVGMNTAGANSYETSAASAPRRPYEQMVANLNQSGPTSLMSTSIDPPRRSFTTNAKVSHRSSSKDTRDSRRPDRRESRDTRRPVDSRRARGSDEGRDPKSVRRNESSSRYTTSTYRGASSRGPPATSSYSTSTPQSNYGRNYGNANQLMTPSWRSTVGATSATQQLANQWTTQLSGASTLNTGYSNANRFDTSNYNKYNTGYSSSRRF